MTIATAPLQELVPVTEKTLSFPSTDGDGPNAYAADLLAGSNGKLWLFRAGDSQIAVYAVDEEGRVTEQQTILPPPTPPHAAGYGTAKGPGHWSSLAVLEQSGPAPLVRAGWRYGCHDDNSHSECGWIREFLVFAAPADSPPLHLASSNTGSGGEHDPAARSADGGLWIIRDTAPPVLQKYDAQGTLLVQQSQLHLGPTNPDPDDGDSLPHMATFSGGVLIATRNPLDLTGNLLRVDPQGNAVQLVIPNAMPPSAVWVDQRDRFVLLSNENSGNLAIVRLASDTHAYDSYFELKRYQYFNISVRSLTEDTAGNLYFLTRTGALDAPVPTLCKLPLDGEPRCYAVPALKSDRIAATGEGIVQAIDTVFPEGQSIPDLVLQRFEVP